MIMINPRNASTAVTRARGAPEEFMAVIMATRD
jgi:hypothetical protein